MHPSDLPLKHCAVLTCTREGIPTYTAQCLDDLRVLGARMLTLAGVSDVTLARNLLISRAEATSGEDITVFLLVDDDIIFSRVQAQLLCEQALVQEKPVSAVYPTNERVLAAQRWQNGLWLCGLGFMAVPRALVTAFAKEHPPFLAKDEQKVWPFCQSSPSPDGKQWWSEDYWFSYNMGGVVLARHAVKHWKRLPLFADEATMAELFDPEPTGNQEQDAKPEKAAE